MKHIIAAVVTVCATLSAQTVLANTLTYNLNNNLTEQTGAAPALVSGGGTVSSTGYSFGANQGLTLDTTGLGLSDYSIALNFEFDQTTGFRRILDFSNGTSDFGLYSYVGNLTFYNVASGSGIPIAANKFVDVVLTRSGETVTGYVDGIQSFSFNDQVSQLAVIGTSLRLFQDDNSVGGEASPGIARQIKIFDRALSASEVAALGEPSTTAVPGPIAGAGLPALMALGGFVWTRRRKAAGA